MAELMTQMGFERLRQELEHLQRKERPELLKTIAWAASNGDRSENADYQYGKKRLREIERRLRYLVKRLDQVRPVDQTQFSGDIIQFGATILLESEEGQHKTVMIVGADEIDPTKGLISPASPLARALMGKATQDEVEFMAPKGLVTYTILKVEYKTWKDE
jgi:transcription elongation factor GreB